MKNVSYRVCRRRAVVIAAATLCAVSGAAGLSQTRDGQSLPRFQIEEARIADIQQAIKTRQITTVDLVNGYLARIKAYNGTCVSQPQGVLGPITPIPHAGQLNALGTLNLRPAARETWGFDDRKARSMTDLKDDNRAMPDALEVAAAQDREFVRTGQLVGPLHGVVISIKDQFDTFDMRTTNGADIDYANDRPPDDSTFVTRLRAAGAIILAKANRGGSQPRSAFGGVVCNPYDTERTPRASSSGSAASVSANMVTCAIGEETGISIRGPAQATSTVGIAPTQELVSRDGMNGLGLNVRMGPICRTVEDAARVLTVVAGYDPKDPLTVFSVGRTPAAPYESFAAPQRLDGVRIGVVREYMDKRLFSLADAESIDIVDRALGDLRGLGAAVVDPGPEGALFQACFSKLVPQAFNTLFTRMHPNLFPVDAEGKATTDHIKTLVDMAFNPSLVPDTISMRNAGVAPAAGDSQYQRSRYLRDRGDVTIRTAEDVAARSRQIQDPEFRAATANAGGSGGGGGEVKELNMADRVLQRFAFQQVVLQCMAEQNLDALVYPTMNIPSLKIQAPEEPPVNGRNVYHWTVLGQQGFPAMTVPAGFTTHVYDRVRDAASPDGTRLVGPTPARLPVGIDFAGRPFSESLLLRIAAAYETATKHRIAPQEFGPIGPSVSSLKSER